MNVSGSLGTGGAQLSISGSGAYGYAVATPSTQLCADQGYGGGAVHCSNLVTVTATSGPITLAATNPFVSSDSEFSPYASSFNTCAPGATLAVNQSCNFEGQFNPSSTGSKSTTYTVNLDHGTGTTFAQTAYGTYGIVETSPTSVACGSEVVGGSTVCNAGIRCV